MAKDTQTYREDEGSVKGYGNGQTRQPSTDLSPADGGDGFIGSNTGERLGLQMVEGKRGTVTSKAIWSSSGDEAQAAPPVSFGGQDSTDENASYKKIQTDEGLPQTFRTSFGAGDAGQVGSDEPDQGSGTLQGIGGKGPASYQTQINDQKVTDDSAGPHSMSDMPQTEFTHSDGGGAPRWKR